MTDSRSRNLLRPSVLFPGFVLSDFKIHLCQGSSQKTEPSLFPPQYQYAAGIEQAPQYFVP